MPWYRGMWREARPNDYFHSFWSRVFYYCQPPKDYDYQGENPGKVDPTVVSYIFSDRVVRDERLYSPAQDTYLDYKNYCQDHLFKPLSSRQFKDAMDKMGFTWQRCHAFYQGRKQKQRVTTAYKNMVAVNVMSDTPPVME